MLKVNEINGQPKQRSRNSQQNNIINKKNQIKKLEMKYTMMKFLYQYISSKAEWGWGGEENHRL